MAALEDLTPDQRSTLAGLVGHLVENGRDERNIFRYIESGYARRIVAEFGFTHLEHHLEGLPE